MLMLRQTLPKHILHLGSFGLRHLGEIVSDTIVYSSRARTPSPSGRLRSVPAGGLG